VQPIIAESKIEYLAQANGGNFGMKGTHESPGYQGEFQCNEFQVERKGQSPMDKAPIRREDRGYTMSYPKLKISLLTINDAGETRY